MMLWGTGTSLLPEPVLQRCPHLAEPVWSAVSGSQLRNTQHEHLFHTCSLLMHFQLPALML